MAGIKTQQHMTALKEKLTLLAKAAKKKVAESLEDPEKNPHKINMELMREPHCFVIENIMLKECGH